jgi:hypothetical protein
MTPVFFSNVKIFAFALIFTIISTITYAFASSNTREADLAGYGVGSINGYAVSDISYNWGNDSAKIASISFTLNAPASNVQMKLSDDQTNWYNCINVNGNNWDCNANNHPISSASEFQVVAIGN